jgi:hypothetical protein
MLEYAALSSSDPADLARQMTERSAQGWEILQIVSTGATVTAFVRRAAIAATISNTATVATAPVASTPSTATPTYASTSASVPTTATTPPVTTTTTSVASSVGDAVAPAAWYPDPSKRYELRYWNGTAWTEHVSRAGQQFTDPPVA